MDPLFLEEILSDVIARDFDSYTSESGLEDVPFGSDRPSRLSTTGYVLDDSITDEEYNLTDGSSLIFRFYSPLSISNSLGDASAISSSFSHVGDLSAWAVLGALTKQNAKFIYFGSDSFYPSPGATYRTNNKYFYNSPNISAYPSPASVSRSNLRGVAAGTLSAYPSLGAVTKGPHIWKPTASISAYPRPQGQGYNVVVIPEVPPVPGGNVVVDLQVPDDVVDYGLQVNHLGGMGVTDFFRSMFIIDTSDYDGSVTYQHQFIAKNLTDQDQPIYLNRMTGTGWDPDYYTTEIASQITIPALTTEWTMFTVPFVPATGSWKYFWTIPDIGFLYSNVIIATARVVIKQIGATKTLLWRPIATSGEGGAGGFNSHLGYSWGSPDQWQRPSSGNWYWNSSLYQGRGVSIVLEVTTGSSYGGVTTGITLWDLEANAAVPGTYFTVTSGGAFRWPQSNVERFEFASSLLTSGKLYEVRFRRNNSWGGGITTDWLSSSLFGRAAFMIRIRGIEQAEIAWRVCKATGAPVTTTHGSSRVRLDAIGYNSVLRYVKNETDSAADFYWRPDPEVDYWITDDDHLLSGDGGAAFNIPESNAHQDPVADLLPIFSADWKSNFIGDEIYCMRLQPVNSGGDANSAWTLILIAVGPRPIPAKPCVDTPCVCCVPEITLEQLANPVAKLRCDMGDPIAALSIVAGPGSKLRCDRGTPTARMSVSSFRTIITVCTPGD